MYRVDAAPSRSMVPGGAYTVLFLMFLAIPILGLPDILTGFQSGLGAAYLEESRSGGVRTAQGLLYMREVLMALLIGLLFLWACVAGRTLPRLRGVGLLVVSLSISAIVSFSLLPAIVGLAGLRQLSYLILIYVAYMLRRDSGRVESQLMAAAVIVVVAEFAVALFEMVTFDTAAGTTLFGGRVHGTFNNPNTLGVTFAGLMFLLLFLSGGGRRRRAGLTALCLLGLFMTGSRTAVVAGLFVLAAFLWSRSRTVEGRGMIVPAALLIVPFLYLGLSALTGREVESTALGDPRVEIFLEQIQHRSVPELLLGRGLGVGTNTLFALGRGREDVVPLISILDSTFTALIVQVGFVGLVGFLVAFAALSTRCGFPGWVLFGLLLIVGVNGNWLEHYPFNLIATTAYGVFWARQDLLRSSERPARARLPLGPADTDRSAG